MEYLIICSAAIFASGLTFFSGFGLGTIMLPVFSLFFPLELAIALTAIVHLLNNIFKTGLIGRKANKKVVLIFGIPALIASFLGALSLKSLAGMGPVFSWSFGESVYTANPMQLVIAGLIFFFALFDLIPRLTNMSFPEKFLPLGGLLSGFFGGLSGHQGAMRSAFLIKAGLSKEGYIATGIVIALFVDVARLIVYSEKFTANEHPIDFPLIIAATLSAFLGAFIGRRLMKKVTLQTLQYIVGILLIVMAIGIGSGILTK